MSRKQFLVGMLYCGEQERGRAVTALEQQELESWELFVLENLPNKAAHDALYSEFMSRAAGCDYFLKLDADMVFRHERALTIVRDMFAADPTLEGVMFDVHDWYSDYLTPGLQVFRSSVRWEPHSDHLMVDPMPRMTGRAVRVTKDPAPLTVHSPDPSPLQAFRFGVHRAMKMLQPDRPVMARDPKRFQLHCVILEATWERFREAGDARRALAIAGAEYVAREGSRLAGKAYTDPSIDALFAQRFAMMSSDDLVAYSASAWDDKGANRARLLKLFGEPAQ